jgi:hypothetical protein
MIIDTLYLEIVELLKERLPAVMPEELNLPAHYDLWSEQTEFLEQGENLPFLLPAVFIEFSTDEIENIGNLSRNFPFLINIYVADFSIAEAFDGSHDQGLALNYLKMIGHIDALLHGADIGSGTLNSFAIRRYKTSTNLWIYILSYTTEIVDESAAQVHRPLNIVNEDNPLKIDRETPVPPEPDHDFGNDYFINLQT